MLDTDGNGVLNFDEFLRGIKLDLEPNRKIIVDQVFQKLDFGGKGKVSFDKIKEMYVHSDNQFI